jgi:hypothetical protein
VDVNSLRAAMCADSFQEMAIALQTVHGNVLPVIQDLFMEQGKVVLFFLLLNVFIKIYTYDRICLPVARLHGVLAQ